MKMFKFLIQTRVRRERRRTTKGKGTFMENDSQDLIDLDIKCHLPNLINQTKDMNLRNMPSIQHCPVKY